MSTDTPVELVPDRLYALGASIPSDGRISWLEAGGWEPLNAYMLVEGSSAYVIDSQLAIVEAQVRRQAEVVRDRHGVTEVNLMFTRVVEFDSMGNAEILLRVLPARRVCAHYDPEQWMYYRGVAPEKEAIQYEPVSLEKDQTLEWVAGRALTTMGAPIRLLACAWMYDHATQTMFTSDGFSHARPAESQQRVLTAADDTVTVDDVRSHLLRKFDYLEGANTAPVRDALKKLFADFEVRRIAPTEGLILDGADIVNRHLDLMDRALAQLAAGDTSLKAGAL
jgi:flavorubredoxin